MPKEQGQPGERAARSASKTAKDKSNSATLRASQGTNHRQPTGMGDISNRMLRCDSEKDSEKDLEKDSGYSEAGSDSVHTDVEDRRSSVSEPHRESSSKSSISNGVKIAGHGLPPYEDLTPIYVIKNLVVKPSASEQLLHSPLPWAGGWHSLTNAKAPTQLLLIQQPTIAAPQSSTLSPSPSLATPQAQPKKGGGRSNQNHCSKNSYLPILNSYPRIAPHPRKESHEGKGAAWTGGVKECGSECHSQSKRVCMEEETREVVSTTSHLLKPQQHQKEARVHSHPQHKSKGGHSSSHCPPSKHVSSSSSAQHKSNHSHQRSSASDSVGSPSVSSSQTPSPPSSSSSDSPTSSSPPSSSPSSSAAHSPYHLAPDSSSMRHRRFLNTAEILNQSGLLAITLQTKELLKQNNAMEKEISQLRQHTHLLCQAAEASQSGCGEGLDCLEKLLRAMSDSNSYPSLDLNRLKVLGSHQQDKTKGEEDTAKEMGSSKTHSSRAQVVSLRNIDDGTSPPSPLFAPSPDSDEKEHSDRSLGAMSVPPSFPRPVNEQGLRQAIMDKNFSDLTCTLPESSTCSDYLL